MIKRFFAFVLIFALSFSLPTVTHADQIHKYSYMFFNTFDTAITLIGYAENQDTFDQAAKMTEELFTKYHKQFDQYYPYDGINNLYFLNRYAAQEPVKVSKELFDLISWCKQNQPDTRGKVNIALGAVLALWHDTRETAEFNPEDTKLPKFVDLFEAKQHTDMDKVVLNEENQTIFFTDSKLHLDVGAVAKGYATELVAQALLKSNMPHFIINAGGNVRTGLPPLDGRSNWGVGIQDPDAKLVMATGNDIMDVLFISDMSLVTSGDYQRFFTYEGIRYHHLIDPDTLMPAHHMRSVTIITKDSGYADLLSTAVFLMPFEEGYAFVQSLEGVDALWVLNDRTVKMTPGAEKIAASMGATNTKD